MDGREERNVWDGEGGEKRGDKESPGEEGGSPGVIFRLLFLVISIVSLKSEFT